MRSKFLALLLTASLLAACTEPNGSPARGVMNGGMPNKEEIGVAAGVVTGGLIGSAFGGGAGQALAIVGGGLLGGVLGDQVGKSLDRADWTAYNQASHQAMNTGAPQSWSHGDKHGTITPTGTYKSRAGHQCRTYTQTIYIDGKPHTGKGKACHQPDGSWKIIK
jgi:surface antigen